MQGAVKVAINFAPLKTAARNIAQFLMCLHPSPNLKPSENEATDPGTKPCGGPGELASPAD